MRKIMVLDTETTGVDHRVHAITQIAGVVLLDGLEAKAFDLKVRPFDGAAISQEALNVTGLTEDDLRNDPDRLPYGAAKKALQDICCGYVDKFRKRDKLWFLGYNGGFDADMIRAMWTRCMDPYFGSLWVYPIIDVAQLAAVCLGDQRLDMPNFKLGTVCRHVGIEFNEDEAHDALYDVRKTVDLWRWCRAAGMGA